MSISRRHSMKSGAIAVVAPIVRDGVEFPRGSTAHIVASPRTALEKRVVTRLRIYLGAVLGKPARTVGSLTGVPIGSSAIVLAGPNVRPPIRIASPGTDPESFVLVTGEARGRAVVVAEGKTDRGLKRAIQRLIILSEQRAEALAIPPLEMSESPWIPHREWTMCPWEPGAVRGVFHNPFADQRMNIYHYGRKRLANYVEMFDWFGFSGCQLMETCYSYEVMGSMDATADWQKQVMRLVRKNGQDVSLWVWAARFEGFGWVDPEVVYKPREGMSAFDDPDVRRAFERYYDHYAQFAPYIDRFFAHFYDPGQLRDEADVFRYMRLLERKLKARNPSIEMGIDAWAASDDYLPALIENGFSDYLLLELPVLDNSAPEKRDALHLQAKRLGLRMGVWGWYVTEYETDQFASMYVNSRVIKGIYQQMKEGPFRVHPDVYWSEMEAHHLNNIYSMYVAGQLLWDPDRDPHQILEELTTGIWGPISGKKVLRALGLIEDTRSGPNWSTYWWTCPEHKVGTDDPASDLRRAEEAISEITGLKPDAGFVGKFPLPYPAETFAELMIPHLKQIKLFAEFRLEAAEIRAAAESGAPKEKLERMLKDAWKPVPEFGTWVGTFGSKELREQKALVAELRSDYGLQVSDPEWLRCLEADRILQGIRMRQRETKEPLDLPRKSVAAGFYWSEPDQIDRFQKLIDDCLVEEVSDDRFRLVDWENWARQD